MTEFGQFTAKLARQNEPGGIAVRSVTRMAAAIAERVACPGGVVADRFNIERIFRANARDQGALHIELEVGHLLAIRPGCGGGKLSSSSTLDVAAGSTSPLPSVCAGRSVPLMPGPLI